jgi:hypothetical protein
MLNAAPREMNQLLTQHHLVSAADMMLPLPPHHFTAGPWLLA